MQSLSYSFENFIKTSLLELATATNIDHRNYNYKEKSKLSPLVLSIKEHNNSFDKGISALCDSIASNNDVLEKIECLRKMHSNPQDNADEIYDSELEFFDEMIECIGLFEITALHTDEYDNFKDKFFACVYI